MYIRPEGTKEKVYAYLRKSTEDRKDGKSTKQVNSFAYQRKEVDRLAAKHNLEIVDYYQDDKTGMTAYVRENFNKMLHDIEDKREVTGIVTSEISRLGRNFGDGGQILWLMQSGSIQSIYTNDKYYSNMPTDQLMMAVIFAIAKYESDENSYRSKQATRAKVMTESIPSYAAPWGYKNTGMKGKKSWIVDHVEAPKVRRVFELYATGLYNLPKLRDAIFTEGIVSSKTGTKLAVNTILQTLKRVSYTGWFDYEGKRIEGKYESIISASLFSNVQEVLTGKEHVKTKHMEHTYSGLVTCGICGATMTATVAKKVITYYRCSRHLSDPLAHKMPYLEEALLNKCIGKLMCELEIDKELWEELKAYITLQVDQSVEETNDAITIIKRALTQINTERDAYIIGSTKSSLLESESYKNKMHEYQEMLEKANERIKDLEKKKGALMDTVYWKVTSLVDVGSRFRFADEFAQRELVKQFCANLLYDGKKLTIFWGVGIKILANGREKSQWLLDKDSNLGPSA